MQLPFAPEKVFREGWNKLSPIPGGKLLISKMVGVLAPYSGTIPIEIQELRPGYSRIKLSDKRGVRNHLQSIHAAALMNFSELCSGAAMMFSLPENARIIITHFEIDFLRKARGTLTGEATCDVPASTEERDYEVDVVVRDEAEQIVVRARPRWRVGPNKK